VARIIRALIDAGCDDLFLGETRRVVAGLEASDAEYSVQAGQKVELMLRLEVVGTADEVRRWAHKIRDAASTGRHGDGVVTIAPATEHFHLSGAGGSSDPKAHS
jgi:nitrogen regulatory protein PII